MLPGAVPASPGARAKANSRVLKLAPGKAPRKRAAGGSGGGAALGKPPGGEGLAGHSLSLNGAGGTLEFSRLDKGLLVKALALVGEQTAKPGESCEVKVALPAPLAASPAGQPAGLLRYDVAFEACPFSFDVLDDAVLISSSSLTCDFKQAGCQVTVSGLWGPGSASFTPAKAKEIEHARTRWEAAVRAAFRDATALAKDNNAVKQAAKEQAGFSSEREEKCRDYAGEGSFGFCAARLTQARAFGLRARTAQALVVDTAGKKGKK